MDDEPLRRNQPTVHVQFGEATAILAAFALVALAARIPLEDGLSCFQSQLLQTLDVRGLIGGQSMDLLLSGAERECCRAKMSDLKTTPLFVLAVRAGLVLSPASPKEERLLLDFGRRFGAAYQTADDLLDGEHANHGILLNQLESARLCLTAFDRSEGLDELIGYLHDKTLQNDCSHR